MEEATKSRAWMLAALPLALLLSVGFVFYFVPDWSNTISVLPCLLLLVASPLVGIGVVIYVLRGWRRGRLRLWRAGSIAALVLAALDILVPIGLVALAWMVVRSMRILMS